MKCRVKTFGIAREILGGKEVIIDINGSTVADLRKNLAKRYPQLEDLNSVFLAVNQNYAADDLELHESDEIAIIPPVSGG